MKVLLSACRLCSPVPAQQPGLLFNKAISSTLPCSWSVPLQVGVGCASAKEVSVAVTKAVRDGKKNLVRIPLSKSLSFPHFAEAYSHSAKVR